MYIETSLIVGAFGQNERREKTLRCCWASRVDKLDGSVRRMAAQEFVHDLDYFGSFKVIDTDRTGNVVEMDLAKAFGLFAERIINVHLILFHDVPPVVWVFRIFYLVYIIHLYRCIVKGFYKKSEKVGVNMAYSWRTCGVVSWYNYNQER
nr:MAG TPA: hypothetical protein [Caudoviricetes sp.]